MLRTLSYLNLIGTVCYFLVYLQNGNPTIILGLLSTIVYQWLILRSQEQERGAWGIIEGFFAVLSLVFALYLGYSAVLLLISVIEYEYYSWNSMLLIGSGLLLMLALLFHLFLSWREKLVKKDE